MTGDTERGNPASPWHNKEHNPCITCGACCANYRVSFYQAECDDSPWGTVPVELTQTLTHSRRVMKGTNQEKPRCVSLNGEIGKCVSCNIHAVRSSVCREFPPSWEGGIHNPDCDKARINHRLLPLENPDLHPLPPETSS